MKSKIGGLINNEGDLKTELKILKSLGYDYAEFGMGAPTKFTEEFFKNYKEFNNILPVSAAHLPPISFRKEEVEESKRFIFNHLKVNCKNFIIHFFIKELSIKEGITAEKINGLKELTNFALEHKSNLILENTIKDDVRTLNKIFDKVRGLYFCLDIGHANLIKGKSRSVSLINNFGKRLKHIHVHDNFGGCEIKNDLHLPIGFGSINFSQIFKKLKEKNYSGDITLEVHSFGEKYRKISVSRIKQLLY